MIILPKTSSVIVLLKKPFINTVLHQKRPYFSQPSKTEFIEVYYFPPLKTVVVKTNYTRSCQCSLDFSLLNLFQVNRNLNFMRNKYLAIIKKKQLMQGFYLSELNLA